MGWFNFVAQTKKYTMKKSLLKLTLGFAALIVGLSSFAQTYTFTACGDSSRFGPNQTMVTTAYTSTTLQGAVTINTQGIQEWTVPATGTYTIEALGAEGGDLTDSPNTFAGKGARMIGEFNLTQGTVLKILVGQRGGNANSSGPPCATTNNRGGGGGGGSFVTDLSNTPLIVAGGGNGDSWGSWNTDAPGALITNTGTAGGPIFGRAGGGGGLIGDGDDHSTTLEGGDSFVNGGAGGVQYYCYSGNGGFGGGGGSRFEGGGGGGYTGGTVVNTNLYNNSYPSYGAGSFNSGTNQVNLADTNSGDGQVIITSLCNGGPGAAIAAFTQDSVCLADPAMTLTSGTPTGGTYSGNGVSGFTFTPNTAGIGTHYVVYTFTDSCSVTTMDSTVIEVESCVGISENKSLNTAKIYPNPTNGIVTIDLGNHRGSVNYSISTIEGRIVNRANNVTSNIITLDLSNESNGIYLLKIESATSSKTYKLVKE